MDGYNLILCSVIVTIRRQVSSYSQFSQMATNRTDSYFQKKEVCFSLITRLMMLIHASVMSQTQLNYSGNETEMTDVVFTQMQFIDCWTYIVEYLAIVNYSFPFAVPISGLSLTVYKTVTVMTKTTFQYVAQTEAAIFHHVMLVVRSWIERYMYEQFCETKLKKFLCHSVLTIYMILNNLLLYFTNKIQINLQ